MAHEVCVLGGQVQSMDDHETFDLGVRGCGGADAIRCGLEG